VDYEVTADAIGTIDTAYTAYAIDTAGFRGSN
jgi:hypothetical protein